VEAIFFSENMTLLFGYIKFIMIIRTSGFAIENYLNISSVHTKKNTLTNQLDHYYGGGKALIFSSDELRCMYQLTCMNNSINFPVWSNKMTSRNISK